jgi:hypothetical protein
MSTILPKLRFSVEAGIEVAEACGRVLDRMCATVALVLDTAEQISRQVDAQAAAEGAAGVGA